MMPHVASARAKLTKNRRWVRVYPIYPAEFDAFTADEGHLDRFRRPGIAMASRRRHGSMTRRTRAEHGYGRSTRGAITEIGKYVLTTARAVSTGMPWPAKSCGRPISTSTAAPDALDAPATPRDPGTTGRRCSPAQSAPAPGKVLNVRWVAGRDDWYDQTSRGWYWLRPEKRV